jgi:hypothetical protein
MLGLEISGFISTLRELFFLLNVHITLFWLDFFFAKSLLL